MGGGTEREKELKQITALSILLIHLVVSTTHKRCTGCSPFTINSVKHCDGRERHQPPPHQGTKESLLRRGQTQGVPQLSFNVPRGGGGNVCSHFHQLNAKQFITLRCIALRVPGKYSLKGSESGVCFRLNQL